MTGSYIATTTEDDVQWLMAAGQSLGLAVAQLRHHLAQTLSPAHGALLAEPVEDTAGRATDWYGPGEGAAPPLDQLPPAPRAAMTNKVWALLRDIRAEGVRLGASADADERVLGAMLEKVSHVPDETCVRVRADGPLLVAWAHGRAGQSIDLVDLYQPVEIPKTRPPVTDRPPAQRPPWLIPALALTTLAVALALYLWSQRQPDTATGDLTPTARVAEAPPPPQTTTPTLPAPVSTPTPTPSPTSSSTASNPATSPSPSAPPAPTPAPSPSTTTANQPTTPPSPTAPAPAANDQPRPPTAPTPTPNAAANPTPPTPTPATANDQPTMPPSPTPAPAAANDQPTTPPSPTPAPAAANDQPSTPPSPTPTPSATADDQPLAPPTPAAPPSPAEAATSPTPEPSPAAPRPQPTPSSSPDLAQLPPHESETAPAPRPFTVAALHKHDLALLQGCWNLTGSFATADVRTRAAASVAQWRACFGPARPGAATLAGAQSLRWEDGKSCSGPVTARFLPDDKLEIADAADCLGDRKLFPMTEQCARKDDTTMLCAWTAHDRAFHGEGLSLSPAR